MHAKACILNTREEEEVLTDVELNGIMMAVQTEYQRGGKGK